MARSRSKAFSRRDVLGMGLATAGMAALPIPALGQTRELARWSHLLGAAVDIGATALWVGKAQDLNWFAEEGLDLHIQPSQGSAQALQVLSAGGADSNSPPGDALIAAAARGQPAPVTAVHLYVPRLHYMPAVHPDSPIKTAEDLVGKRIGVFTLAHAGTTYIKAYLAEAGLDNASIEMLPVGQGLQAGEALYTDKVDALVLWDTTYQAMMDNGYDLRFLPQSKLGEQMFANLLVANDDVIKNRPRELAGWLRAVNKGIIFTFENPEAAAALHYQIFPETRPTGKSLEQAIQEGASVLRARAPQMVPKDENMRGLFDVSGWQAWIDFMGVTDQIADPTIFFTNEFIEEANNFDHDAIKKLASDYKI